MHGHGNRCRWWMDGRAHLDWIVKNDFMTPLRCLIGIREVLIAGFVPGRRLLFWIFTIPNRQRDFSAVIQFSVQAAVGKRLVGYIS